MSNLVLASYYRFELFNKLRSSSINASSECYFLLNLLGGLGSAW